MANIYVLQDDNNIDDDNDNDNNNDDDDDDDDDDNDTDNYDDDNDDDDNVDDDDVNCTMSGLHVITVLHICNILVIIQGIYGVCII